MRYLALGDSYTSGEGVGGADRWPVQLAALLRGEGTPIGEPEIIARTGWTTDELEQAIAEQSPRGPYDLVTLLIGVNDQYRGRAPEEYRTRFVGLLQQAAVFAGGEARRVIVLSIPDWGVTPFAAGRDRARISSEIDRFNAINRAESVRAGACYVDITPRSRAVGAAEVVADGLHPSPTLYAGWARAALPSARAALRLSRR